MLQQQHWQQTIKLKKGFTLIELVMVLVILGILAGFAVPLTVKFVESFQYSIYRKDLSEQADVALRRMSREIRRLKDDRSVETANATTYEFIVNDEQDPSIQHTIRFQWNDTNLVLERVYDDGEVDILASDLSYFNFTYLKDDAITVIDTPLVLPQPTDIRLIEINMTLESDNNTIYYRTQVRPRNLVHLVDLFS